MATRYDTVQVIKRGVAYRAKYRAEQGDEPTYITYHPFLVVPHPAHRGGMPVVSMRTKQLVGTIIRDSCDVPEANHSAVAVEEKDEELSDNENPRWRSFQWHYEEEIAADIHMVKHGGGSPAIAGCLSHGHFNCACRNIICGMPGCVPGH